MEEVCDGCLISIRECVLLCADNEQIKNFLLRHNIISASFRCPTCDSQVKMNWKTKDFRCQKSYVKNNRKCKCNFKRSIFNGTFLERVKLPMDKMILLICYWLHLVPPRQDLIISELEINKNTAVDWQSFSREVLIYWMEKNDHEIGGEGEIVEIDEAKIGKRKYHRGRAIEGQWVFGGVLRSDHTKCFIMPVENRSKETLLAAIKNNILPGTTIYSDCWKAYDCLEDEGFIHLTVNHSQNFVHPTTKAHTQNIERLWRDMRGTVPRFGRSKDHYKGYLAEFKFKRVFSNFKERVHNFFLLAAELYNPNVP